MSKIIIVGGGLSGLASGIYGQLAGFETEIYEKNPRLGGLCTFWDRKGYHIDGCLHWLTGSRKNTDLYHIWSDLGVKNFLFQEDAGVFFYENKQVRLYCDIKKIEEEFIKVAPEDKKQIKQFIKLIVKCANMPQPMNQPINTMSFPRLFITGLKILPYLPFYLYCSNTTCEKYSLKFSSPFMRKFICSYQVGPGVLYPFLFQLTTIVTKNGGVTKQCSKGFISNIIDRYLSLGGKIFTSSPVKKINIENKTATGITLENDKVVNGDYVVSAIDAETLINHLLLGRYKDKKLEKRFSKPSVYSCPSCFMTYLAVNKKKIFEAMNKSYNNGFSIEPFTIGGRVANTMIVKSFGYDDYFDKDDNTVIEVLTEQYSDNFAFWSQLAKDKKKYNDYKNKIIKIVIERILKQYPSLDKKDISYIDSFTPITLNRFTNSYKGSFMSFMMTKKSSLLFHPGNIKGIKNFYFSGQWSYSPGGLPFAAGSGMFTIQRILKKTGKKYIFHKEESQKFKVQ